ncbi:MAG: nicotinamide riboside transporter PnuC [Marinobacter sp.]|nr:nicotinamide riboside transporter PnuC [Marinobacter sp.]
MDPLTQLEYAANGFFLVSVFLAARNSIHTWWLGIIGCVLFGVLFYKVQLYAETTLMLFFIGTSVVGWYQWGRNQGARPITRTQPSLLVAMVILAITITLLYGWLLNSLTDAYAPFVDSAVLMFSVLAQLLLMNRKLECWWFWLVVNTIAVPLYLSRDLNLTALVYAGFWFNAWYGLYTWQRKLTTPCQNAIAPA